MNTIPRAYNKRELLIGLPKSYKSSEAANFYGYDHKARIKRDLKSLGASYYGMIRFGSRYLPKIIHPDEKIGGVVYGFNEEGSVMLLATDRRMIYINKKPLFFNEDEMSYEVIGGARFAHAGIASTVTLHTRLGDYKLKTFNKRCAIGFIRYVESRCLEHAPDS